MPEVVPCSECKLFPGYGPPPADAPADMQNGITLTCPMCGKSVFRCNVIAPLDDAVMLWNEMNRAPLPRPAPPKIKLPRVQAAALVEGKNYVVLHRPDTNNGSTTIALCDMETMYFDENLGEMVTCEPFPVLWPIGGEFHHKPDFYIAMWGPIEFDLEGAPQPRTEE